MKVPTADSGTLTPRRLDPHTLREIAADIDRAEQEAAAEAHNHKHHGCIREVSWTSRAQTLREAATELRTAAIKIDLNQQQKEATP